MPRLRIKVNSPILPILTIKLVAIAMSSHKKKGQIGNLRSKYLPCGENLVKIGPLDPEFSLLRDLL